MKKLIINLNNGQEYETLELAKLVEKTTHIVEVQDGKETVYVVGDYYTLKKYRKSITGKNFSILFQGTLKQFEKTDETCAECGKEMDVSEHNYGTEDILVCTHCYHDAQETGENYDTRREEADFRARQDGSKY